jgi:cell division septation protein DedD
MTDEGFHEIQLNGKQLVFLFMAATVVAVVIFLSGVMVGRGVRPPRADLAAASTEPLGDPTDVPAPSGTGAASSDRVPLSAQETLTYAERLEAPDPPAETLKDPTAPINEPQSAPTARETSRPAPAPVRETARADSGPVATKPAVENAAFNEPAGSGYVVQVMAAVKREEAEGLARRLTAKGYPTFVSVGDTKGPAKFRVRVGKYRDKREADAVVRRLEQEEHFKPWLTR